MNPTSPRFVLNHQEIDVVVPSVVDLIGYRAEEDGDGRVIVAVNGVSAPRAVISVPRAVYIG